MQPVSVCVCACLHIYTGRRLRSDTLHLAPLQLADETPYGVSQFLPRTPITLGDLCLFNRQAPYQYAQPGCSKQKKREKKFPSASWQVQKKAHSRFKRKSGK